MSNVYGLVKDVQPLLVSKPVREFPRPDNWVFKLHYKVTVAVLAIGAVLVSAYSYIDSSGSAIQCMIDKNSPVPQKVMNRFCWIQSTFTLPQHFEGTKNEDFVHYGVGPHKHDDEKIYHAYYQWVPLMLSIQAICFYAPHWIWKQLEGGRFKAIVLGLNQYMTSGTERDEAVSTLANYMRERIKYSGEHNAWAYKFFFCEVLNFINVIAQIFITDAFLGGEFTEYGVEVIRFARMEPEERVDPMSRVFPKMTKCTFHKYGGSGTLQLIDAMCVLGMNILSEKIYILLWFWFIILSIFTGFQLVIRIIQMASKPLRNRFVKLEGHGPLGSAVNEDDARKLVSMLSYADWLILYYLAAALNRENFAALVANLAEDLPEYPRQAQDEQWFARQAAANEARRLVSPLGDASSEEGDGGGGKDADTLKSPAKLQRGDSFPMNVIRSLSNKGQA